MKMHKYDFETGQESVVKTAKNEEYVVIPETDSNYLHTVFSQEIGNTNYTLPQDKTPKCDCELEYLNNQYLILQKY